MMMSHRFALFFFLGLFLAGVFGCAWRGEHSVPASSESPAEKALSSLTIEQKIGQLIMVYYSPLDFLEKYQIGSVIVFSSMLKKPRQLSDEIKRAQEVLPLGLLVALDQEGGNVNRLRRFRRFKHLPSAKKMGRSSQTAILKTNTQVALFLKRIGVNLNLAPVLDPEFNAHGEKTLMGIRRRSFGEDENTIIAAATAFIQAFQDQGVGCVVKHFPGYDVSENSDHELARSDSLKSDVFAQARPFFLMREKVNGIMMNSIQYSYFCDGPAVFCRDLVKWAHQKMDGVVITDDLWGKAIRGILFPGQKIDQVNYPDSAFMEITRRAFDAGNDILMITYADKVPLMIKALKAHVRNNPSARQRLNESVLRILTLKQKLGVWSCPAM